MTNAKNVVKQHHATLDWVTITTTSKWDIGKLEQMFYTESEVLPHQMKALSPWAMRQFKGRQANNLKIGWDGPKAVCMQFVGDQADKYGEYLLQLFSDVTRVDLAVTVLLDPAQEGWHLHLYERAKAYALGAANRPGVVKIENHKDGVTIYSGKRVSDRYLRVYDKGVQALDYQPGRVLRYEVEYKGKRAIAAWRHLRATRDVGLSIASQVAYEFDRRKFLVLWDSTNPQNAIHLQTRVLGMERKLEWLRTQVRPTVRRLLLADKRMEVYNALGLQYAMELEQIKQKGGE